MNEDVVKFMFPKLSMLILTYSKRKKTDKYLYSNASFKSLK